MRHWYSRPDRGKFQYFGQVFSRKGAKFTQRATKSKTPFRLCVIFAPLREIRLRLKPLLKLRGRATQLQPLPKDLRILEPNSEPLRDFGGECATFFVASDARGQRFELAF